MADTENLVQEEESMNIRDMLSLCRSYWKWIVLSAIVCLALGVLYLLRTPKTYNRSAIIMIKDDTQGRGGGGDVSSMFQNMGFGGASSNVYNELSALVSPSIIMEAGKRLGLDMNYTIPGTFHDEELYGASLPVNVRFLSLKEDETASLKITLNSNGTFSMTDFRCPKMNIESQDTLSGKFNQVTATPVGKVMVVPTNSIGSFLGEVNKPITVWRTTLYSMTTRIQHSMSAELANKQSTIVNISYQDGIPERATDIINTVINVYKESWLKDKNQVAIATAKFITKRLGELEQSLGGLDANISSYRSSHLIPDDQSTAQLYLQQSRDNSKEMLRLQTQRSMAEYVRSMLLKDVHSRQLLPANSGIDNAGIESQISNYNKMLLERNSLAANSSSKNPLVEDYDQHLSSMRRAIVQSLDNLVAGVDTQVGQAAATVGQTNSRIASVPGQTEYLNSVGRKQKVAEQLYMFLLQKREENDLSQAFTAYNVRIISPPFGSMRPVAPRSRMILLIALAIGLAIPIGIIFIRTTTYTKLRGRKDLESLTVPFLAEIPYDGKVARRGLFRKKRPEIHRSVVVEEGEHNIINEAFRVLRTKLEFMMPGGRQGNVILVTSFNAGSGKSFMTANIAMSFVIKKKKVLIIDCDLRKGTASTLIHSPKMGITHYLTGKDVEPEKITYQYRDLEDFNIIPVGVIPPNPTELLGNGKLKELLDEVRSEYDYIFLDCPPVEVVADTEIISAYADRTLFVVRAGLLDRALLPELQKLYDSKKYSNMTVILNGTESSGYYYTHYGYGYAGGYSYKYYYGKSDHRRHRKKIEDEDA